MMAAARIKTGRSPAWKTGWSPSGARGGRDGRYSKGAASRPSSQLSSTQAKLAAAAQGHALSEPGIAADLDRREHEIESGFARLNSVLQDLAPGQFAEDFPQRAVSTLSMIGIEAEEHWFKASWTKPLDMGVVHARCASRLFAKLVETGSERIRFACSDGEQVDELIRRWGFHAVDITACADGRLAGLLGPVLRVPLSIVTARQSYAGAMFDVAGAVQNWEKVELGRWRTGLPNQADEPTRYLKIGVYHYSSVDPNHEGCAAHGSDDATAIRALNERLNQFKAAIEISHGAGDTIALLMVGVDTDTDAIRVHVPGADGTVREDRYVSAVDLYDETKEMSREAAKEAIRTSVADCTGVADDDAETEGMRWLCGYLLKNNLAQVEAVLRKYDGPHPVAGHAEKLIVIGDPVDDVQLRNLAFQAQMGSVEEGAGDLAVGLKILGKRCAAEELCIPVLVLRDYDPELPGDEEAACAAAIRMSQAVEAQAAMEAVVVEAALRPVSGGKLKFLNAARVPHSDTCCGLGRQMS